MTQPRPEPFGTVALSPALLHNNFFSAKWFIATAGTLQSAFPPLQHISLCCEVEGKWLQISFWQYLWEMTIDSHFITSLFLSWAPALKSGQWRLTAGGVKPWRGAKKWTTSICPPAPFPEGQTNVQSVLLSVPGISAWQVRLKVACQPAGWVIGRDLAAGGAENMAGITKGRPPLNLCIYLFILSNS